MNLEKEFLNSHRIPTFDLVGMSTGQNKMTQVELRPLCFGFRLGLSHFQLGQESRQAFFIISKLGWRFNSQPEPNPKPNYLINIIGFINKNSLKFGLIIALTFCKVTPMHSIFGFVFILSWASTLWAKFTSLNVLLGVTIALQVFPLRYGLRKIK